MFVIGEAVIDDAVGRVSFQCDLTACKGACCCIAGGRGAPLAYDEVGEIQKALPVVSRYLSELSLRTLAAAGPVEGRPGDYATTCIGDRECVFVIHREGIALCAFEQAYRAGETRWPKPLSCHLFPIRIGRGEPALMRYEEIEECAGGRLRGRLEKTLLYDFLKEPLIRRFGQAWYQEFRHACEELQAPDRATSL